MSTGNVSAIYSPAQLSSSSAAAVRYGVPVNIVRGVTGYNYGAGASGAQFDYVASRLAHWYSIFFKQSGVALAAWGNAAAKEMPGASALQVATATSNQSVAKTGMALNPAIGLSAAASGIGGAALSDLTDTGAGATAGDTTAAAGDAAAGEAGAGGATGRSLSALSSITKRLGTADVLTEIWDQARGDAKYAAVTVAVLALGAMLIYAAFRPSGGGKIRIVPA